MSLLYHCHPTMLAEQELEKPLSLPMWWLQHSDTLILGSGKKQRQHKSIPLGTVIMLTQKTGALLGMFYNIQLC